VREKKYFIYLDINIGDADRLEMQRKWVYRREVVGSKKIHNIEYNPKLQASLKLPANDSAAITLLLRHSSCPQTLCEGGAWTLV
jgi:hypothetical protein